MITTLDIAWVAGLVEGEGTFVRRSEEARRRSPARGGKNIALAVRMTDADIVARLAQLWGVHLNGPYRSRIAHHKPAYSCRLAGDRAIAWMMTLYPFLGVRRRAKVRDLVELWRAIRRRDRATHCRRGHALSGPRVATDKRGRRTCLLCKDAWTHRQRSSYRESPRQLRLIS